jgi:hypothetical protein
MLPVDGKDPLVTFTEEQVQKSSSSFGSLKLHHNAKVCASHWSPNPNGEGSIYHGACCFKANQDWIDIFVIPGQDTPTCKICNAIMHYTCFFVGEESFQYCFGCFTDQQQKKEYWKKQLLLNHLKLTPPKPVCEVVYGPKVNSQLSPKSTTNGTVRDRFLPEGVLYMCCCHHDGNNFKAHCLHNGDIKQEDPHGQCSGCKKYLHEGCSVRHIIQDPTDTLLCCNCVSHVQSKKVDEYYQNNQEKYTLQQAGHMFSGPINWIRHPNTSPNDEAVLPFQQMPPAAAEDEKPTGVAADATLLTVKCGDRICAA